MIPEMREQLTKLRAPSADLDRTMAGAHPDAMSAARTLVELDWLNTRLDTLAARLARANGSDPDGPARRGGKRP